MTILGIGSFIVLLLCGIWAPREHHSYRLLNEECEAIEEEL